MKRTAILLHHNKSFDKYFFEMKKRNNLKGFHTTANGHVYKLGDSANDGSEESKSMM